MITLNEVQSATIAAIIDGRVHGRKDAHGRVPHHACTPAGALEKAGHTAEVQADLVAGGWLTSWDRKDGTFLTLSPEAAQASRVEIGEHLEFAAIDHPTRTRRPLGRVARGADGRIARDFDGRILRNGIGGTIPREPATGKAVPERAQQSCEEPHWQAAPSPLDPATGRATKTPRRPIVLPVRFRESYLGEYGDLQPASREMDPLDAAIANEEYAMVEARKADGRLDVDAETGKAKRVPRILFGQKMPIDPALSRGRKRPKAKRKARAKT